MDKQKTRARIYLLYLKRVAAGGQPVDQPEGVTFPVARLANELRVPEANSAKELESIHRGLDRTFEAEWQKFTRQPA